MPKPIGAVKHERISTFELIKHGIMSLPDLNDNVWDAFSKIRAAHPDADVVTVDLFGTDAHMIFNPALVEHVPVDTVSRHPHLGNSLRIFGSDCAGVVTATAANWESRHDITTDFFAVKNFDSFTPVIQRCASELTQKWKEGNGSDDYFKDVREATSKTILSLLFGENQFDDQTIKDLAFDLDTIINKALRLTLNPLVSMTKGEMGHPKGVKESIDRLGLFIKTLLERYPDSHFVQEVLKINGATSVADLKDETIRKSVYDEIGQLLIESMSTTSNGIGWTLLELGQRPELQSTLVAEAKTGKKRELYAVLSESLRLHSVLPVAPPRCVEESGNICGVDMRKNDLLLIPIYTITHDPAHFTNANQFDHTRYLGQDAHMDQKAATMHFSHGAQTCTGKNLYRLIASEMVMNLVNDLELKNDGPATGTKRSVVHKPKSKLAMQVSPRLNEAVQGVAVRELDGHSLLPTQEREKRSGGGGCPFHH